MISFFKKIRQCLFNQNPFAKNLAYAFGEFALTIIGVLHAIKVKTRHLIRQNQKQEQQLLTQLKIEFQSSPAPKMTSLTKNN
ncbi:hypothetical protein [Algoriphagus sp.]|uniref:hypothetical protein n=1 Tax=Algoriphagus sp. TaxID=1872435 RepID=UPI0025F28E6F|nr:hypothetical protein [Algoriphagus sp.]